MAIVKLNKKVLVGSLILKINKSNQTFL